MDEETQQLMKEKQRLVDKVCMELIEIEKDRRLGKWTKTKNSRKN